MSQDNSVHVCGNVTRDPEMRYTASGIASCGFGIAVSKRWQNKQTQEWEEKTSFFNIQCWRQTAENVGATVTKGMRVVVTGELEQRSWETEGGEKRSVVQITADDVAPSLRYATADVQKVEREKVGAGAPAKKPQGYEYPADEYSEEPF